MTNTNAPRSSPPPTSSSDNTSGNTNSAISVATHNSSNRSSSRRRGTPTPGVPSSSHILRTTSTAAAAAAGNNSGSGNVTTAAGSGNSSNITTGTGSGGGSGTEHTNSNNTAGNATSTTNNASIMIAPPPRVAVPEGSVSVAGVNGSGGGVGIIPDNGSGPGTPGSSSNSIKSYSIHRHHSNSISSAHSIHSIHSIHGMHGIQGYSGSSGNGNSGSGSGSGNGGGSGGNGIGANPSSSSGIPASAAATAQLVKEKDLRIAQLQRDMSVMEAEFARELDKLSKAESASATFWQAKHARVQQQMVSAESTMRLLRAQVDLREAESTDLRSGWEEMRELRDTLQHAAAIRDEEVRALREQVRGLKEWVSTSTRADGPVALSDEVFADGMARLANGLQNWVIVHFRRAKLGINPNDLACDELFRLVPMYEELVHSSKLHLLQSVVSHLLVEIVFDAYFVGLPAGYAAQMEEIQNYLHSLDGTAEPINQWRALTLSIANKGVSQGLESETHRVTEEVVDRVNDVLDAITDAPHTEARDQALRALVASAIDVSRQLRTQKAAFEVTMPEILPHQQVLFDASVMEDIGGEEDDGLAQREIACVTFPGIIKLGDETGSHMQYRNVICKARVLCAPE